MSTSKRIFRSAILVVLLAGGSLGARWVSQTAQAQTGDFNVSYTQEQGVCVTPASVPGVDDFIQPWCSGPLPEPLLGVRYSDLEGVCVEDYKQTEESCTGPVLPAEPILPHTEYAPDQGLCVTGQAPSSSTVCTGAFPEGPGANPCLPVAAGGVLPPEIGADVPEELFNVTAPGAVYCLADALIPPGFIEAVFVEFRDKDTNEFIVTWLAFQEGDDQVTAQDDDWTAYLTDFYRTEQGIPVRLYERETSVIAINMRHPEGPAIAQLLDPSASVPAVDLWGTMRPIQEERWQDFIGGV